jgi:hypothetical protein
MSTFSISTGFTQQDLERFYASGTNVIVAKPTGGSQPNVAWIVFRPLISNSLTWEENYGIYASNVDVQNGATLTQMSATPYPAVASMLYAMQATGAITGPNSGGSPNAYSIINLYNNLPKGYLTMGLYQNANVDGTQIVGNAVSAAAVLYQSTATMTPMTTVYLWLQSQVVSNTVVTTVTSPMTRVTLSGSSPAAALVYNATTGTFIPAVPTAASRKALSGHDNISEDAVEHLFARL